MPELTYNEVVEKISQIRLDQNDYYNLLLDHSTVIVHEVERSKKGTVALELGMTSQVFTQIYKVLEARASLFGDQ